MAQGPVRSAEGEGVGKGGDANAEVRGNTVGSGPEIAKVSVVRDEWEPGQPGSVKARRTYYHIYVVMYAFVIHEACWGDGANVISENGCILSHKGFYMRSSKLVYVSYAFRTYSLLTEIAWCGRRSSTARIEILWNHLLCETRVVVQFLAHFAVGVVAC